MNNKSTSPHPPERIPMTNRKEYGREFISKDRSKDGHGHWRVFDPEDNRVATCYDAGNADAIVRAFNRPAEPFFAKVRGEVERAYAKHGRDQWGRHEFYAILKEEVDELWDAIKADEPQEQVLAELVQVAAMCLRYAETGDRYREPANV